MSRSCLGCVISWIPLLSGWTSHELTQNIGFASKSRGIALSKINHREGVRVDFWQPYIAFPLLNPVASGSRS